MRKLNRVIEHKSEKEAGHDHDKENWSPNYNPYTTSGKVKQSWLSHSKVALRTNIYRYLYPTSNRDLSVKLSDSAILRWFCHVGEFGSVKPPTKSPVNRYQNRGNSDAVYQIIKGIIQQAAGFDTRGTRST